VELLERDIQKTIIDYLRLHRVFCIRVNGGALKKGSFYIRFTDTKGVADLIGCYNSRFFAVECKSAKGEQSRAQAEFQASVERAGGIYCLARDVKDVERMLKFTERGV
jgi:hypothetical protein